MNGGDQSDANKAGARLPRKDHDHDDAIADLRHNARRTALGRGADWAQLTHLPGRHAGGTGPQRSL